MANKNDILTGLRSSVDNNTLVGIHFEVDGITQFVIARVLSIAGDSVSLNATDVNGNIIVPNPVLIGCIVNVRIYPRLKGAL